MVDDDYQERVQKAVVMAIMRASAVDIGDGKQGAHIRPLDVSAVLTKLVAEFLAGHANADELNRKAIRELSNEYGKILRQKIEATLASGNAVPAFYEVPSDPTLTRLMHRDDGLG
jgi:hypothetical protein